jgi:hypothetical protein
MKRWDLLGMLGALLVSVVPVALACPICLGASFVPTGQQLEIADQVVLAVPVAKGRQFRIVEVVKGNTAVGQLIAEPVRGGDAAIRQGQAFLLLRHDLWPLWSSVGAVGVEYAGWLRQLAGAKPSLDMTDANWRDRVALVLPYLENPEPLAADIAYGEMARAPYGALRALKPRLEAATIAGWIDDPQLAARRSAYTLLLGIAGGPQDAERLEQRLEAAWKSRDATNLSAMLAADLELHGPSRVDWIETRYLADRYRTMPEIEAALLALSEHGKENGAVSRQHVIQAYRLLMRERQPMAAFVARDLAEWEYWDATPEYVALLKSNVVQDPASRYAIVNYLQRSPRADAKVALESLPVADRSLPVVPAAVK